MNIMSQKSSKESRKFINKTNSKINKSSIEYKGKYIKIFN